MIDELVTMLRLETDRSQALEFIRESNRIEGIIREPTPAEVEEFHRFMCLKKVTVAQLERFVAVYQPNAVLRREVGLNVRVGAHVAPPGGPAIERELKRILRDATLAGAYRTHVAFETLHPFTDCNGRSGRMLWAWQMKSVPLAFLRAWYYQSLAR